MISLTFINLIVLTIFSSSVLIWKYIYPKRAVNLFLLLICFSCIPLIGVWRPGSYQSGDFQDHLYFLISFYKSLSFGILVPRWSGAFCGGYGYPHIQFFYLLPYYLSSLFHVVLRISFLDSLKLLISLSFIGGAASIYLWLQSEWGKVAAFLGSLVFILSPYLLAGAFFRVTVGEGVGTVLVPIVLWLIKKTFDDQKRKNRWHFGYWWGICAVYSLLILAHHVVPILCLPFVITYFGWKMWLSKKLNWKKIGQFALALIFAFLLTAFHWLPILLESNWIGQNNLRVIIFPEVYLYFFAPWRFGLLNQGHHGELSWTVGYVQWFMLLIGVWLLFIKKNLKSEKKWLVFYFCWFAGLFFMMFPFTESIWLAIPIIRNFQFATRNLFLINLIIAAISAIAFNYFQKKLTQKYFFMLSVLLVVALCITTILNWGQRAMIPDLDDQKLTLQIPQWCDQVAIPDWLNEQQFKHLPKRTSNLTAILGNVQITDLKHDMEDHQYLVTNLSTSSAQLRENTTYFPGWKAYDNGQNIPIEFSDPTYNGIMKVTVSPGEHHLEFVYEHTLLQTQSIDLSVVALLLWSTMTIILVLLATHE